jgi:hypothetical protein
VVRPAPHGLARDPVSSVEMCPPDRTDLGPAQRKTPRGKRADDRAAINRRASDVRSDLHRDPEAIPQRVVQLAPRCNRRRELIRAVSSNAIYPPGRSTLARIPCVKTTTVTLDRALLFVA